MWLLVIRNHDIATKAWDTKVGKMGTPECIFIFYLSSSSPPHLRSYSLLMRSCWQDMTRSSAPRGQRGLASRGVKSKLMVMMMQKKSNSSQYIQYIESLTCSCSFPLLDHFANKSNTFSLALPFPPWVSTSSYPGYQDTAINGTLMRTVYSYNIWLSFYGDFSGWCAPDPLNFSKVPRGTIVQYTSSAF